MRKQPRTEPNVDVPTPTQRERFKKIVHDARENFIKSMEGEAAEALDPESIRRDVIRMLDAERKQITLKFLGFDNRWGDSNKWEVDHCNSRNSAVTEYIKQHACQAAQEWLDRNMRDFSWLTPDARITAAMKKDLQSTYNYTLQEQLRRLACEQAQADAKRLHKEMVEEFSLRDSTG